MKNYIHAACVALSLVAFVPAVQAADEVNLSQGLSITGKPLALHGYDPVAYFTLQTPTRGSDALTHVHRGATYRFVSEEHRKLFAANPERYLPQFGGYCAYGVTLGKKFDGDPNLWQVVDDRLYLNLNPEILALFNKDVPQNIRKAGKKWSGIEHTAVVDL